MSPKTQLADLTYTTPSTKQAFTQYYDLRWQILRQPWSQPKGSERDELEHQSCHRMLLSANNECVAVIRFHKISPHECVIRYMAIAETWQRQGVGHYLMSLVEQEAISQGISDITLKARENAIPFYQAIGFSLGDYSHTLYDNIVHFTMTKKLSKPTAYEFASQLTTLWHNTIPISQTMQIACVYVDAEKLITTADKITNQNLHHTMFAGSQYSLLTLTGWGWVYYLLHQQHLSGDIVLAKANIRYLTPCHGHAHAITTSLVPQVDLSALKNNKKVKVSLQVTLFCGDIKVAIFDGDYAVIPKTTDI